MHDMEVINGYLSKANKPIAVGFERNPDHPAQVRFFDKDNRTVFLPDKMYREMRDKVMKGGLLQRGRVDMRYWRSEAEKQAIRMKMKRSINKHFGGVINAFKALFNSDRGRRR